MVTLHDCYNTVDLAIEWYLICANDAKNRKKYFVYLMYTWLARRTQKQRSKVANRLMRRVTKTLRRLEF